MQKSKIIGLNEQLFSSMCSLPTQTVHLYALSRFQEPYTVQWLYEHGVLRKNGKIPFVVTTGSGRSKGNFTVVIKPK